MVIGKWVCTPFFILTRGILHRKKNHIYYSTDGIFLTAIVDQSYYEKIQDLIDAVNKTYVGSSSKNVGYARIWRRREN